MKAYKTAEDFRDGFTYLDTNDLNLAKLEADCEEVLKTHGHKPAVKEFLDLIATDIGQLRMLLESNGETAANLADLAILIGARWASMKSSIERPRSGGRIGYKVEWACIRRVWSADKSAKQSSVVSSGLAEARKQTGKPSKAKPDYFERRFSQMVKRHH